MRRLTASLTLASLLTLATPALTLDPTDELLTSPRVRSWVTFKLYSTGKDDPPYSVEFAPDTREALDFKTIDGSASVVTSAQLSLYLAGYAPFSMRVTSSTVESVDPAVEAIEKFLDAVSTLGGELGIANEDAQRQVEAQKKDLSDKAEDAARAMATTGLGSKSANVRGASDAYFRALGSAADTDALLFDGPDASALAVAPQADRNFSRELSGLIGWKRALDSRDLTKVTAPEIFEWFMWFSQQANFECFDPPQKADATYGALYDFDLEAFRQTGLASVLETYKTADSRSEIATAAGALATESNSIKANVKEGRRRYDDVQRLATGIATTPDLCAAFDGYTKSIIVRLLDRAKKALDAKDNLRASIDDLTTELKRVEQTFRDEDHYRFTEVPATVGKLREVTLSFEPRNIAVDKNSGAIAITFGKKIDRTLRVRDYSAWAPQFALGGVFADVDYPQFGTAEREVDGETVMVVEKVDSEAGKTEAAALLNLPFRTGSKTLHPMMQLGVSTGKERPSLLVGGGFLFSHPKHLALSVGALLPWFRELDSLKPGDPVIGTAQIEEDLKLKLQSPELYVGLVYSF